MIHFISEGGLVKRYVCDSADEIVNCPKVAAGSTVQVITTGEVYTIDETGEWKLTSSISAGTGTPGKDGYTPVKGVDYFTEEDMAHLATKNDIAKLEKYGISNVPKGTIVDIRDKEIIIVCPENAEFIQQNPGEGGSANMYYMTFTTYAPENAVTFKEGDKGVLIDEVLNFEDTTGTGVDKYGRKFKNHWFALASLNGNTWSYFGDMSNKDTRKGKYIGWDYVVEYYDADGNVIDSDAIRINLATKDNYFVSESSAILSLINKIESLEAKITELESK